MYDYNHHFEVLRESFDDLDVGGLVDTFQLSLRLWGREAPGEVYFLARIYFDFAWRHGVCWQDPAAMAQSFGDWFASSAAVWDALDRALAEDADWLTSFLLVLLVAYRDDSQPPARPPSRGTAIPSPELLKECTEISEHLGRVASAYIEVARIDCESGRTERGNELVTDAAHALLCQVAFDDQASRMSAFMRRAAGQRLAPETVLAWDFSKLLSDASGRRPWALIARLLDEVMKVKRTPQQVRHLVKDFERRIRRRPIDYRHLAREWAFSLRKGRAQTKTDDSTSGPVHR